MAEPAVLEAHVLTLRLKNRSREFNDFSLAGLRSKSKEQTIELKTKKVVAIAVFHRDDPLMAA
jgi:hypothetical protein